MNWFSSIRGRLALVSAAVIASALTLAGFGLVYLFNTYIEKRVAQELRGRVLDVAGAFTLNDKGEPSLTRLPSDPRYRNPYGGTYWFVREGPVVVLRSRSLWDGDIAHNTGSQAVADNVSRAIGPGNSDVYLLEKNVSLDDHGLRRSFVLGVAVDQTEVQDLSSSFGNELVTGLALLGLVLFSGAWLQARYGLQPLVLIRQQLTRLHRGEREKLDGPFPAEIENLAEDLNTLFSHQKDLIARARERAGSLAHGLKTPMTILYGEAGKLRRSGQPGPAQAITEQLDLIQQQVDRELARARAHGTSAGIGLQSDVSATAVRLVALMQRMPSGDAIEWHLPPPGYQVTMDADDFGEVLGNLLDNARKWAVTQVKIDAEPIGDGHVRISISDDGAGIPEALRSKVLERGESVSDGSGLGLAIVSDLIQPYGATLAVGTSQLGGARLSFDVPGMRLVGVKN